MSTPMTHRLIWGAFDCAAGKHTTTEQDFSSEAEANAAKADVRASNPDAAAMVLPIGQAQRLKTRKGRR